jgi:hypothetical protein
MFKNLDLSFVDVNQITALLDSLDQQFIDIDFPPLQKSIHDPDSEDANF